MDRLHRFLTDIRTIVAGASSWAWRSSAWPV